VIVELYVANRALQESTAQFSGK
jgi:hypothetical protein